MDELIKELEARIVLMKTNVKYGMEMVEHHQERKDKELQDVLDARHKIIEYHEAICILKEAMGNKCPHKIILLKNEIADDRRIYKCIECGREEYGDELNEFIKKEVK